MVNPNNPNSEPDGVSPSEPGADPSSSESGPISDELFDSLSELLGDSPTTDEPASLPDIESWSEASEPTAETLPSSLEDSGESFEEPTLIQMPEVDTPLAEELSAIEDSLSGSDATGDLDDILAASTEAGNVPVPDPWADAPEVPLSSLPVEPGLPDDLTSGLDEEPSLPDIETSASVDPSDIVSDPWTDPVPTEPTPTDSIAADLEDQTLIQAPDVQVPSEAAAESPPDSPQPISDPWADVSEPSTPVEAATEELLSEPAIPTPELSEPELDSPPITEPIPEASAESPSIPEASVDETLTTDFPIPEGEPLPTGEEASIPVESPLSIDEDSPFATVVPAGPSDIPESAGIPPSPDVISTDLGDIPTRDETATEPIPPTSEVEIPNPEFISSDASDIPTGDDGPISPDVDEEVPIPPISPEFISSDAGDIPTSEAATEPIPPVEETEPTAEITTETTPLGGIDNASASTSSEVIDPIEESAEPISEISPSETEATPIPATPGPEPIAVAPSTRSSTPPESSAGDLGVLSDKLPLNRYQAVGLLVALSTLGTVTYLGVTGNQQDPSLPGASPSSPSASPNPVNDNQSSSNPLSQQNSGIAAFPPSTGEGTPSTGANANPPGQTPNNQTAAVPQTPTEAIGGLDAPAVIPSQLDISDVPEDHWAYPFITKLHAEGIIPDYPDGKFQPDKPVTRAELAAQIQRAFVNEPGQRNLTFSDIASDYWAADAIEGAVDKKFMSGYPEGDFQPDKLVPRYEVLVALVSGLELDIPNSPETSLQQFQDQGQLPDWSKGKIAASTQENIVVSHPDPGLLKPETNATRAEVAAMIYQALVQSGRLEPIESEYVVTPDS